MLWKNLDTDGLCANSPDDKFLIYLDGKNNMDIINHFIIGRSIANLSDGNIIMGLLFSIIADLPVIIGMFIIGKRLNKSFRIATTEEDRKKGYRLYPRIEYCYLFFHSLLSLPLYIFLSYLLWVSPLLGLSYGLAHIMFDILTHRGRRSIKLFYPFSNISISGYINARSLPWSSWIILNCIMLVLYISLIYLFKLL